MRPPDSVPARHLFLATRAACLLSLFACSSSGGGSGTPPPTLVTVDPSSFQTDQVCGDFPGAWRTYVATLTDVTDPARPFQLPASQPVSCALHVSFAFVVPDHVYVAEVEAYDRIDLVPFGGASSGSPHMVDPVTGTDVSPRWRTECGLEPAASEEPPVPLASRIRTATTSRIYRNIVVQDCRPLEEIIAGPEAGLTLDLTPIRGALSCGTELGQVARYRVIPGDPAFSEVAAACDESLSFSPVVPGQVYDFRVEAFEGPGTAPRWAARCTGRAKAGVTLPVTCDLLTEDGGVRVDIEAVLKEAGHSCSQDDVVSYRAVLLGSTLPIEEHPCSAPVDFSPLGVGAYQVVIDAYGSDGSLRLNGFCDATVTPALLTPAECQLAAPL